MSREVIDGDRESMLRRLGLRSPACLYDPVWTARHRERHLSKESENDLRERGIHIGGDGSILTRDQYVFHITNAGWGRISLIHRFANLAPGGQVYWCVIYAPSRRYNAGVRAVIHATRGPAAFAVRTLQRAFRARVRRRWDRVVADALAIASCYVEGRKGGFVRTSKIN